MISILTPAFNEAANLPALYERLVDTMVRGFVYEAAGSVDRTLLEGGAALVRDASERWHMPTQVVETDPAAHEAWVAAMARPSLVRWVDALRPSVGRAAITLMTTLSMSG